MEIKNICTKQHYALCKYKRIFKGTIIHPQEGVSEGREWKWRIEDLKEKRGKEKREKFNGPTKIGLANRSRV